MKSCDSHKLVFCRPGIGFTVVCVSELMILQFLMYKLADTNNNRASIKKVLQIIFVWHILLYEGRYDNEIQCINHSEIHNKIL